MFVLPRKSRAAMLTALLNAYDTKVILYKTNTSLVDSDVKLNVTEADFTGYAAVTITAGSWTVTEGALCSAVAAKKTFTSSANSQNQTVYGFQIVKASDGTLLAEQSFDIPAVIVKTGDKIEVTPTIYF